MNAVVVVVMVDSDKIWSYSVLLVSKQLIFLLMSLISTDKFVVSVSVIKWFSAIFLIMLI